MQSAPSERIELAASRWSAGPTGEAVHRHAGSGFGQAGEQRRLTADVRRAMGAIAEIAILDIFLVDAGAVDGVLDRVGRQRHRWGDIEPAAPSFARPVRAYETITASRIFLSPLYGGRGVAPGTVFVRIFSRKQQEMRTFPPRRNEYGTALPLEDGPFSRNSEYRQLWEITRALACLTCGSACLGERIGRHGAVDTSQGDSVAAPC